jgi:carboxymethylenebutenolidase
MYDAMLAESVTIIGHGGDEIEAYSARTLQAGPVGGVVVIHHLPGYDRQTAEFTRAFAAGGLNAVMPNLYHREAPGAAPDDAMAAARASGAIPIPDGRIVGEVAGAAAYLRGLSNSNGKVGVIGHCSGGRQAFLAAVSLQLQAAVDCYGGFVVGTPPEGHPLHGWPSLVDQAADLTCPLLGLFGKDDVSPSPEDVAELEAALKAHGKTYEFHSYEGAGHAFMQVDRTNYRPEAAVDAWQRIWAWFGRYLLSSLAGQGEESFMCTYLTEKVSISGSGKGPSGWFRVTDASVYFDHPVHAQAEHTLNIDFLDPGAGPSARVAVELTADSARALAKAIQATLDSAPPGLIT